MKKATKEQISHLQTIYDNLQKLWYSIEDKKGMLLQATQALKDIDYFSEFYQQIYRLKKDYKSHIDFNEPINILKNAINYYKIQDVEPNEEQYNFSRPIIIENPKVIEPSKLIEKQALVTPIKQDLEKIKLENIKLRNIEQKRLELQAKILFRIIVFLIPVIFGLYFIKVGFNWNELKWKDPLTWVDVNNFSKIELLIVIFEIIVIGLSCKIYDKFYDSFALWYYNKYKLKH